MAYLSKDADHGFTTLAEILLDVETTGTFRALEQTPIAAGLAACRDALDSLQAMIGDIWNPEVRSHFARVIEIMTPHFRDRENRYRSLLGMPDNGNPRTCVRSEHDMEPFYHDHAPTGAYAEWLEMRAALLFSHVLSDKTLVERLGQHFQARFVIVPCSHCRFGFHDHWVSPFDRNVVVRCPVTGESDEIDERDMRIIAIPEAD